MSVMLGELRHTHFPYCLQQQEDGRWVVLNRNYKPIGFVSTDYIRYEEYPVGATLKKLSAKTMLALSHDPSFNEGRIYLYDDSCIPTRSAANMRAYLEKLVILMKLKHGGMR